MTAATLATRRTKVLTDIADEHLAEEDATEARRKEAAEVERAAAKRHQELSRRRDTLRADRIETVAQCEAATQTVVNLIRRVLDLAAAEREILVELRLPSIGLSAAEIARRLSRFLSAALRSLPGATAARFGELQLARYFAQGATSWAQAERRASGVPDDVKERKE